MPVHTNHIIRIVDDDDITEVLQTVKRALRCSRLVFAAHTVRHGSVHDVQSLLEHSRDLLMQCDLGRLTRAEIDRLFASIDQMISRAREHLDAVVDVHIQPAVVPSNARGRPKLVIDIDRVVELRELGNLWSDIADSIGCSRKTLGRRLQDLAPDRRVHMRGNDPIPDDILDDLVRKIKHGHAFVGSAIVKGHLAATDVRVSLKRVKASLLRVDPLGVARRRHRSIWRRVYKVPGANFLWHMDQNEKLQPWGFMLHGCVDGHSRLHLWAECRTNKRATTVLRIAYATFGIYGIPLRIRADRGTENNAVEDFMIAHRGADASPFLRGRSVQNVRIERLWGDVCKDSTEQFRVLFTSLESDRLLKMELRSHRLCLILTYMDRIQTVLDRSRHAWNNHQIRTARHRTPLAMYELSREELINSERWASDGERPEADVGADRSVFNGDLLWAQNVMGEYDFLREDGQDGVRVFVDAVRVLEARAPEVNDRDAVLA